MSSQEMEEWQVYFKLEPFGPWALNLNFGKLMALLRNMNRKKGTEPSKPTEFAIGDFSTPKKKQNPQDIMNVLFSMVRGKK